MTADKGSKDVVADIDAIKSGIAVMEIKRYLATCELTEDQLRETFDRLDTHKISFDTFARWYREGCEARHA